MNEKLLTTKNVKAIHLITEFDNGKFYQIFISNENLNKIKNLVVNGVIMIEGKLNLFNTPLDLVNQQHQSSKGANFEDKK